MILFKKILWYVALVLDILLLIYSIVVSNIFLMLLVILFATIINFKGNKLMFPNFNNHFKKK